MSKTALAVCLSLILAAAPFAQAAKNVNTPVKQALMQEVSSVNLTGTTFADAIEYLRDISNANIVVHWKVLEDAHITRETPVTVRLRSVSMRRVLQFILDDAGGNTPLTYYIDQGVIEITTREAADAKMITRLYDVGDLVVDVPDFVGPDFNIASGSSSSSSGGSSGGGSSGAGSGSSLFSGSGSGSNTDKASTVEERGNELVNTIMLTIRPEIWQTNGGTATIKFFHGKLIVTAPRSVQEMLGGPVE